MPTIASKMWRFAMSDPQLLDTIEKLSFLRGVPEEDLRQLAALARLESHPEKMVLFKEGSILNRMFIVAQGKVALEISSTTEKNRRIFTVSDGELLGWPPILRQSTVTATARTLTAVTLVSISSDQLLEVCHRDPRFGFLFMERTAEALAAQLSATRLQLLDVLKDDLPVISDEPGAGD
jgi:CRP-like cAMP-binding protein